MDQIYASTLDKWRCQVYNGTTNEVIYDFVSDAWVAHELARAEQMAQYPIHAGGPYVKHDATHQYHIPGSMFEVLKCLK